MSVVPEEMLVRDILNVGFPSLETFNSARANIKSKNSEFFCEDKSEREPNIPLAYDTDFGILTCDLC